MDLIFNQQKVPYQWLIAKTITVYKNMGLKNEIGSYGPIINLCAASRIFKKLI
jgi:hypothetical protein